MPPWVYIVPEHIWGQYADLESMKDIKAVDAPQIGSGPFTLTEWERGQSFTFDRNPEFWGAEPAVDRIVYRVFTNEETMVQALKNGEIDFADGLSSTLFDSLRGAAVDRDARHRVGLVAEPRVQLRRAVARTPIRCPRCTTCASARRS